MCMRVVAARLPQILKFIFPSGLLRPKKYQKTLILVFDVNSMASLNCTFFRILVHCALEGFIWNNIFHPLVLCISTLKWARLLSVNAWCVFHTEFISHKDMYSFLCHFLIYFLAYNFQKNVHFLIHLLLTLFYYFSDFSSTGTPRRGPKIKNITEFNYYSTWKFHEFHSKWNLEKLCWTQERNWRPVIRLWTHCSTSCYWRNRYGHQNTDLSMELYSICILHIDNFDNYW